MKLKTLLEEFVRSIASLDPWCILTQTRVEGARNLPGQNILSGKNPDSPVSRDHAPDLDAQMESRLEAVSLVELSWSLKALVGSSSGLGLRLLTLKSIGVLG